VDYRLASVLHPKFKLAFLSDDEKMHYKHLLVSYVNDVYREVNAAQMLPAAASGSSSLLPHDSDDDDLYSFFNKPQTSVDANITEEVDRYLAQPISSLQAFTLVAEAFQKSNSTLPSSAAVERLFSAASQMQSG